MVTRTLDPALLGAGIAVVTLAQLHTGIPDPAAFPPAAWAELVRVRQRRALGVWVALDQGSVIGHALAERVPANHDYWPGCPDREIAQAASAGALVEIGALAVHPEHTRRGIAAQLLAARLDHLSRAGLPFVVSSAWAHSAGSVHMATTHAELIDRRPAGGMFRFRWSLT